MSVSLITKSLQNPGTGITYEITNPQGVKSYLIGTCHFSREDMIKESYFHQIIDKCSHLYNEIGTYDFITSAHGSVPESDHQYTHVRYRYVLDTAITLAAWCRKIPITSLDDGIPEEDQLRDEFLHRIHMLGPDREERQLMYRAESAAQDQEFVGIHNSVKEGDIIPIMERRQMTQDNLVDKREEHWAKTLIPKLLKAQKSICIAVGALHVVGSNSLSDRFEKAGLKVELIKTHIPSHL